MEQLHAQPDALSLAQVPPEAMDRDELVVEVRRLRLRLEALREQRDERIVQLQELEEQLRSSRERLVEAVGADVATDDLPALSVNVWRLRAEQAEANQAALLATRSMRALRVPRAVYGRIRDARSRLRRGSTGQGE